MKKKIALTLAAMMAATQMAMAAPHGHADRHHGEKPVAHVEIMVGMANPWTDHESLSQAQKAVGVKLDIPDELAHGRQADFRTLEDGKVLEVIYRDAAGNETARIRKTPGRYDVSGDYVGYTSLERVAIGTHEATIKGFDRNFTTAVWENNGYSYSVHLEKPISRTGMKHLLAHIN